MMSSFISEIGSKPDAACTIYWATRKWGKIAKSEGGGRLEGACEGMIVAREGMIQTKFSVKLSLHKNSNRGNRESSLKAISHHRVSAFISEDN